MKTLIRSLGAALVVVAASGALLIGFSGTASAAAPPWEPDANSVGGLTFYDSLGQPLTGGNLTGSPIAAYIQGTSTIRSGDTKATLFGYLPVYAPTPEPSTWSGEQLSGSDTFPDTGSGVPSAIASSSLPLVTSANTSIGSLQSTFPNTDTSSDGYAGLYVLRLKTGGPGLSPTTQYDSVDVSVNNTTGTWSVDYPSVSLIGTTTVLSASPASPQPEGTSVQLNATVSPTTAGAVVPSGTVEFEGPGGTQIGTTQSVSPSTPTVSVTTDVPIGTDDYTAVFTPNQFQAYSGSQGQTTFDVPASNTAVALSAPSTDTADQPENLTATVTDSVTGAALPSGAGSVAFYDNGAIDSTAITSSSALLGSIQLTSSGSPAASTATLTYGNFNVGNHYLVAQFTPASGYASTYNASATTTAVDFDATTPTNPPAQQNVDVTIPAGTLTITTPYSVSSPFNLGTASLNSNATAIVASAPFGSTTNPTQGVTVTDTLADGTAPWSVTASATNFLGTGSSAINAQNLSLTGLAANYLSGNAYQTGSVNVTNVPSGAETGSPYGPSASGSDGLAGGGHTIAASTTDGPGTVYIDGTLTLDAPTSTPAGPYTATLTFTVV